MASTSKQKILQKLEREIARNIYLTTANKVFLLQNAAVFPEKILKSLLRTLEKQNREAQKSIEAAIDADPALVSVMKAKTKRLKQHLVMLREREEKSGIEHGLEEQLKKI